MHELREPIIFDSGTEEPIELHAFPGPRRLPGRFSYCGLVQAVEAKPLPAMYNICRVCDAICLAMGKPIAIGAYHASPVSHKEST